MKAKGEKSSNNELCVAYKSCLPLAVSWHLLLEKLQNVEEGLLQK